MVAYLFAGGYKNWVLASVIPQAAAGASIAMGIWPFIFPQTDLSWWETVVSLTVGAAVGPLWWPACMPSVWAIAQHGIPDSLRPYANHVWDEGILSGGRALGKAQRRHG